MVLGGRARAAGGQGFFMDVIADGWQACMLGVVAEEEEKEDCRREQTQPGDKESRAPAELIAEEAREQPGEDIADGVTGGEAADEKPAFCGSVPIGDGMDDER